MNNETFLKTLHIIATYGEFIALREASKTLVNSEEVDKFTVILIKKQKYLKLLKHFFKEDHPEENDAMIELLTSYQSERENAKRKMNTVMKEVRSLVSIIENAIADFDPEKGYHDTKAKLGLAKAIKQSASKASIDRVLAVNTKDTSANNLKEMCIAISDVVNSFSPEILAKVINETSSGVAMSEMVISDMSKEFNKLPVKVGKAVSGIREHIVSMENIGKMCPNPMIQTQVGVTVLKPSEKKFDENGACLFCKDSGFVDVIVDHDFDYSAVWEREPCMQCKPKLRRNK